MQEVRQTPVTWTPKVRLRDGQIGQYVGVCPIVGKHRVQTFKNQSGEPISPPTAEQKGYTYTTWLLDDLGRCRGDLAESPRDYAGAA